MRRRIVVHGVVQGVGFRPHVYALARALDLTGAVWNTCEGVVVEVEGLAADVTAFVQRLRDRPPPLAVVASIDVSDVASVGGTGFTIAASEHGAGRTFVSPDVAICDDCLAELRDPSDRRYRHPFITCTNCGPRFTVTTGLPYDRPATTLADFPLCERCTREYDDPGDRRFHAQTLCCPDCGPRVSLVGPDRETTYDGEAVVEARHLLAGGAVVAVKGIGGYHLACDATSDAAVEMLRKRKQRGNKAFALMVAGLDEARRLVDLDAPEAALLTARGRPIVLARRRSGTPVADQVAPGSGDLGVMLAYTPLHHLLLGLDDVTGPAALVMTSGNVAGEPIVTDDREALLRLSGLADAWLAHDRPIHVPCDDSVTRLVAGHESPVRRSRGQAPLPVALPFETPPVLAVGGDLKNTFCVAEGRLAWLSAHVGDMDDLATITAFGHAVDHLEMLTGVAPARIGADRHPGYRSRTWALDHSDGPVEEVQHHHAHVASTMVDNGASADTAVLGVAFDGTGYGDDGAVWGGEFLRADYASYTREAHLPYVALPGGDAGVRNPCRMALSHLRAAGLAWDDALPPVRACADDELRLLDRQLETGVRCVPTSSMGRLFDAVSSLAGVCHRVGYDAQAAMELEARARPFGTAPGYAFAPDGDPGALLADLVADVRSGCDPGLVAARFQTAVVGLVVGVLARLRDETGIGTATLSGGVFLNAYLTAACAEALGDEGFEVLTHHQVPASDAGIALGQVAVLAHRAVPTTRRPLRPSEQESPCA